MMVALLPSLLERLAEREMGPAMPTIHRQSVDVDLAEVAAMILQAQALGWKLVDACFVAGTDMQRQQLVFIRPC
jgi:hypothetical protein